PPTKRRRGRSAKKTAAPTTGSAPAASSPLAVKSATRPKRRRRRHKAQRRLTRRVTIAPGIALTTRPGSLYATILKVLASLGHLEQHETLFKDFLKEAT